MNDVSCIDPSELGNIPSIHTNIEHLSSQGSSLLIFEQFESRSHDNHESYFYDKGKIMPSPLSFIRRSSKKKLRLQALRMFVSLITMWIPKDQQTSYDPCKSSLDKKEVWFRTPKFSYKVKRLEEWLQGKVHHKILLSMKHDIVHKREFLGHFVQMMVEHIISITTNKSSILYMQRTHRIEEYSIRSKLPMESKDEFSSFKTPLPSQMGGRSAHDVPDVGSRTASVEDLREALGASNGWLRFQENPNFCNPDLEWNANATKLQIADLAEHQYHFMEIALFCLKDVCEPSLIKALNEARLEYRESQESREADQRDEHWPRVELPWKEVERIIFQGQREIISRGGTYFFETIPKKRENGSTVLEWATSVLTFRQTLRNLKWVIPDQFYLWYFSLMVTTEERMFIEGVCPRDHPYHTMTLKKVKDLLPRRTNAFKSYHTSMTDKVTSKILPLPAQPSKKDRSTLVCTYCEKKGHSENKCKKKKRDQKKSTKNSTPKTSPNDNTPKNPVSDPKKRDPCKKCGSKAHSTDQHRSDAEMEKIKAGWKEMRSKGIHFTTSRGTKIQKDRWFSIPPLCPYCGTGTCAGKCTGAKASAAEVLKKKKKERNTIERDTVVITGLGEHGKIEDADEPEAFIAMLCEHDDLAIQEERVR